MLPPAAPRSSQWQKALGEKNFFLNYFAQSSANVFCINSGSIHCHLLPSSRGRGGQRRRPGLWQEPGRAAASMWDPQETAPIKPRCNELASTTGGFRSRTRLFWEHWKHFAFIHGSAVQWGGWGRCEQTLLSSLLALKRMILQKEPKPPISSWKEVLRHFSQLGAFCFSNNLKYYEIPSNLQPW